MAADICHTTYLFHVPTTSLQRLLIPSVAPTKPMLLYRPLVSAEGTNGGLPKLRVNTAKELKRQVSQSAEPALMDFYSPVSSLYNSPLSGCNKDFLRVPCDIVTILATALHCKNVIERHSDHSSMTEDLNPSNTLSFIIDLLTSVGPTLPRPMR